MTTVYNVEVMKFDNNEDVVLLQYQIDDQIVKDVVHVNDMQKRINEILGLKHIVSVKDDDITRSVRETR